MKDRAPALQEAIRRIGGVGKTAEALGIGRRTMSLWAGVPRKHVSKLSDLSGVPKEQLRPDLYPGAVRQ